MPQPPSLLASWRFGQVQVLGGHCIPIDPFYLTWKAREFGKNTRFIELAGEINTTMPDYVISKVADALNEEGKSIKGSKILVLGLAYKANVDDCRESPSPLFLWKNLKQRELVVEYHDSYVPWFRPPVNTAHFTGKKSVDIEMHTISFSCLRIIRSTRTFDFSNYSMLPCGHQELYSKETSKILPSMSKKYLVTGAAALLHRKSVRNYWIRVIR